MNTRLIILAGIIILLLVSCTGTVLAREDRLVTADDPGSSSGNDNRDAIGPGNPLFGLKVAMENLDETFTFNETLRVEKQVDHAQTRIEEVQQELDLNRTRYVDRALELYWQKLNQTETALPKISSTSAGLLHAQEMIARHQAVLADLNARYPNNTGLTRAFANSQELEQKFGEKTQMRFEQVAEKDNKTTFKAVNLKNGKQNNANGNTTSLTGSSGKDRNESPGNGNNNKQEISLIRGNVTSHPTPGDDRNSSQDQGKKGRN
jgi:Domain of unknown function (DUF5667)